VGNCFGGTKKNQRRMPVRGSMTELEKSAPNHDSSECTHRSINGFERVTEAESLSKVEFRIEGPCHRPEPAEMRNREAEKKEDASRHLRGGGYGHEGGNQITRIKEKSTASLSSRSLEGRRDRKLRARGKSSSRALSKPDDELSRDGVFERRGAVKEKQTIGTDMSVRQSCQKRSEKKHQPRKRVKRSEGCAEGFFT